MSLPKKRKNTTKKRNIINYKFLLKIVAGVIAFFLCSLLFFFLSVKLGAFGKLPDKETLAKIENNVATEIYSADSVLLGRFYIQERTNTKFDDISKNVIEALIATEDARFYDHTGVDYRSLARVFFKTFLLFDRNSGGGSTISQQLAKNLFPRKEHGWLTVPVNKISEIIIAGRIESIYSKEQILTLYLNTVPFGDNVYGIDMASRRFFNKKVKNLKIPEAAVLVGMLKANYYYNPRLYPENSIQRRNVVMHQMTKYGYLSSSDYNLLKGQPLGLNYKKITHDTGVATYFREQVRQDLEKWCEENVQPDGTTYNLYTDGLKVYTTINASMQKYAEEAMKAHFTELQSVFVKHWNAGDPWKKNAGVLEATIKKSNRYKFLANSSLSEKEIMDSLSVPVPMKIFDWKGDKEVKMSPIDSIKYSLSLLQTGILAMNPDNGDIKAWVGGINYEFFKYDHVNVNTKRQVGSTFKPFVYAAALEAGAKPCNYISGERITYTNLANWNPGNASEDEYDKKYTFKGALAHSVNTVTVRVLEEAGIDNTIAIARKAGITSALPEVPSIALGTADISLLEMVSAYCAFANGGYAVTPRHITSIQASDGKVIAEFKSVPLKERVITKENAIIMNSLLQAVVNEGTAGRYRWKYRMTNELAGKTGTTQSNTDGWFIGYNPGIVVGTWVGADNPVVHFRTTNLGSGANMALPVVAKFFHKMQEDPKLKALGYERFPALSEHIQRMLACEPEKEDKQFMEWLFGDKKDKEKKTAFGEKEEKKKKNIFDKIGSIFKKKKND